MAFEEHDEIPEDITTQPQELSGAKPILFYFLWAGLTLLIVLLALAY